MALNELDEIRDDAQRARLLREGVPGQQRGMDDLARRMGASSPQQGAALRAAPPADMSELKTRLTAPPPSVAPPMTPAAGYGPNSQVNMNPPQLTTREKLTYQNPADIAEAKARLSAKPAAAAPAPAVPPRNVPLNTGPAYNAGRAVGTVARVAGPALAGAGVVGGMGTYKIDDPDVDSSAGGTIRAVANGDFSGARRSLSKGALETGMDLAGSAAGAIDAVLPGQRATNALNSTLKSRFGDQLQIADPAALRAAVGLGERVTLTPDAQRRVAAGETAGVSNAKPTVAAPAAAPATQPQRASNVGSTSVAPQPRTIEGVATAASQPDSYRLGENAVEIIRPGGDQTVQVWRPDGSSHTVQSNDFYSGKVNSTIDQGARIRAAAGAAAERDAGQTETERKMSVEGVKGVAQQRVQNEGSLANQRLQNEGSLATANVRNDPKVIPPAPIKDVMGQPTGKTTPGYRLGEDGKSWVEMPVQGGAKAQPTAASIKKLQDNAKNPKALEAFKNEFGLDPMTYLKK